MSVEKLNAVVEDTRVTASIAEYKKRRSELQRADVLNRLADYLIFERPQSALTLDELTFVMHGHRLHDWADDAFLHPISNALLHLENTFRGAPDLMMAQYGKNPYAPIALGLAVVRPPGCGPTDQHNDGIQLSLTRDNRRKYRSRLTVPFLSFQGDQNITPVWNDLILVEADRLCYKSIAGGTFSRCAFGTPAIVGRLDGLEDEVLRRHCLTAVEQTEEILRASIEPGPATAS